MDKIILPTSIKYLDITKNFIDLLKINWPEAYKNLIISIVGSNNTKANFGNIPVVRNSISSSLPTCVSNAALKYKADYYLIFLGDAFISQPVNNKKVELLLSSLIIDNINYCRLLPQISRYINSYRKEYRRINTNERYGHSFIAFGASYHFIMKEFSHNITDRDFEIRYLKLAEKKKIYILKIE